MNNNIKLLIVLVTIVMAIPNVVHPSEGSSTYIKKDYESLKTPFTFANLINYSRRSCFALTLGCIGVAASLTDGFQSTPHVHQFNFLMALSSSGLIASLKSLNSLDYALGLSLATVTIGVYKLFSSYKNDFINDTIINMDDNRRNIAYVFEENNKNGLSIITQNIIDNKRLNEGGINLESFFNNEKYALITYYDDRSNEWGVTLNKNRLLLDSVIKNVPLNKTIYIRATTNDIISKERFDKLLEHARKANKKNIKIVLSLQNNNKEAIKILEQYKEFTPYCTAVKQIVSDLQNQDNFLNSSEYVVGYSKYFYRVFYNEGKNDFEVKRYTSELATRPRPTDIDFNEENHKNNIKQAMLCDHDIHHYTDASLDQALQSKVKMYFVGTQQEYKSLSKNSEFDALRKQKGIIIELFEEQRSGEF